MRLSTIIPGYRGLLRSLTVAFAGLLLVLGTAGSASAQEFLNQPVWTVAPADVPWLSTASTVRGGTINPATGNLLIPSREAPVSVVVVNPATGDSIGVLSVAGVSGGTFVLNKIAATSDGQIFASNLASPTSATTQFKIYRWENESSAPELVWEGVPSEHRYGDAFNVSGTGANVVAYAAGSAPSPNLAIFNLQDGASAAPTLLTLPAAGAAQVGIVKVTGENALWINNPVGGTLKKIDATTGAVITEVPTTLVHGYLGELAEFMIGGETYLAVGPGRHDGTINESRVLVLNVTDPDTLYVVAETHRWGVTDNRFAPGGFVTFDAANRQLIAGVTQNAIQAFSLNFLYPPEPELLTDPLWKINAGDRPWFANDHATRGGAYNPATDNVIVISRTGGLNGRILNAATGAEVAQLNVSGISGGTFPLSEIAITQDGQIFGSNLVVTSATPAPTKIYHWRHERAVPRLVFDGLLTGGTWTGGAVSTRYGDGVGVFGTGSDIDFYLSGSGNDQVVRFEWDGDMLVVANKFAPEENVQRARYGLVPVSDDRLWINGPATPLALVDARTGAIIEEALDQPLLTASGDLAVFELDGKTYLLTGPKFDLEKSFVVAEHTGVNEFAIRYNTEVLGTNTDANNTGFAAWDFRRNNVLVMSTNNAIASYSLAGPPATVAATQSLITSPADGASVTLSGPKTMRFAATWTASTGATGYRWEVATDAAFTDKIGQFFPNPVTATTASVSYEDLDAALAIRDVNVGQEITLYHRAVAVHGGDDVVGAYSRVHVTRGELRDYWTVAEVRAAPIGAVVNVRGVINSVDYGQYTAHSNFFIQDEVAGLGVFYNNYRSDNAITNDAPTPFNPGVEVEITGTRAHFNQMVQVNATAHQILDTDAGLPEPIVIGPDQFTVDSPYQGMRVAVEGVYLLPTTQWPVPVPHSGRNFTITGPGLDDEERFLRIVGRGSELAGADVPKPTGYFDVAGTLGRFNPDPQMFAWFADDLVQHPQFIQFIHSAADHETLNIFMDGELIAGPLAYGEAIAYAEIFRAVTELVIVSAAGDTLASGDIELDLHGRYAVVLTGDEEEFMTGMENARLTAENENEVEFFVVHSSPDAGSVTFRLIEGWPFEAGDELASGLEFTEVSDYIGLEPAVYTIQMLDADTGAELDAFEFDFSGYAGQTLVLVAEGYRTPTGDQPGFTLSAYTAAGTRVTAAVVTTIGSEPADLPQVFALRGNYPNPFNPTTKISFDLPQTAEVSVEIFDVAGRRVMSLPAQQFGAGHARTIDVDGMSLASGMYLYRITARMASETIVQSGRMTLLK
jgi:hypothetical protein